MGDKPLMVPLALALLDLFLGTFSWPKCVLTFTASFFFISSGLKERTSLSRFTMFLLKSLPHHGNLCATCKELQSLKNASIYGHNSLLSINEMDD